jgi:hypothetical protein
LILLILVTLIGGIIGGLISSHWFSKKHIKTNLLQIVDEDGNLGIQLTADYSGAFMTMFDPSAHGEKGNVKDADKAWRIALRAVDNKPEFTITDGPGIWGRLWFSLDDINPECGWTDRKGEMWRISLIQDDTGPRISLSNLVINKQDANWKEIHTLWEAS